MYHDAAARYGVPWELLAAINELETDYGRNVAVSSAGALGWMQFMPATWSRYGIDANRNGRAHPGEPVDAVFAAARYLRAAGVQSDVRRAVFAYNHADWYVNAVLARSRTLAALPPDLVTALTALARGRFPLASGPTPAPRHVAGDPALSASLSARPASPVVAPRAARVTRLGRNAALGRFVALRDAYGNSYVYGRLSAPAHPGAGTGKRTRGAVLRRGSRLAAGDLVGRIGTDRGGLLVRVRPPGRGAPWIDARAILEAWRALDAIGLERASVASRQAIERLLALPTAALERSVLRDRRIEIYPCGRRDVAQGRVDRRVLVVLAHLAAGGLRPRVTSLVCGHGRLTANGAVSHHASGNAVDIAAVGGVPILGHQGPGSVTEKVLRRVLALSGPLRPDQVISLMTVTGSANALAMPDHADHVHVGFRPGARPAPARRRDWQALSARIAQVRAPVLPASRRKLRPAPRVRRSSSRSHRGGR